VCLGSTERGLGLAAVVTDRIDDGVSHLEAAVRADRRLGSRPMMTLTEDTLAAVLRLRRAPGDAARADQLSQRADQRAARLGMTLPGQPTWLLSRWASIARPSSVCRAVIEPRPGGWRIEVENRTTLVPDRVGFGYLAELVARPGRDVDVVSLAAPASPAPGDRPDAVLDADALRTYRRRARDLTAALSRSDLSPAEEDRHQRELATLTSTLSSATGLGGRVRTFPGIHERARTAVRKALVRAIDEISAAEPELGRHLQASVETGATCRYTPGPGWILTMHHGSGNA
jgi:hypothetical protein